MKTDATMLKQFVNLQADKDQALISTDSASNKKVDGLTTIHTAPGKIPPLKQNLDVMNAFKIALNLNYGKIGVEAFKQIDADYKAGKPLTQRKVQMALDKAAILKSKETGSVDRLTGTKENIRLNINRKRWIGSHISIDKTVFTKKGRINIIKQALGSIFKLLKSAPLSKNVFKSVPQFLRSGPTRQIDNAKLNQAISKIQQSISKDNDAIFSIALLEKNELKDLVIDLLDEKFNGLLQKIDMSELSKNEISNLFFDRDVDSQYTSDSKTVIDKITNALLESTPTEKNEVITINNTKYGKSTTVLGTGSYGMTLKYNSENDGIPKSIVVKSFKGDGNKEAIKEAIPHHYASGREDIKHPNISNFLGIIKNETGGLSTIQEYIPGKTMDSFFSSVLEILPEKDQELVKKYLFNQLLDAMNFLHEDRGMLHLDLKPENIMIDKKEGVLKLVDFGISKTSETTKNTKKGTEGYIDSQGSYNKQSDIYSMGMVFRKTVCDSNVNISNDFIYSSNKSRQELIQENESVNGIPEEHQDLFKIMTAEKREDRAESIKWMRNAKNEETGKPLYPFLHITKDEMTKAKQLTIDAYNKYES